MSETLFGIPLTYISLVTLTIQNSSLILVMHYSRVMPGYDESSRYYTSTAVLLNEVLKFLVSLCIAIHQQGLRSTVEETINAQFWKMSIPALIYTLQNSLQYVAISNLDAASYQITCQLKILTTAFFAVTMLHRRLSSRQWLCLVLLTLGIGLVQMPADAFYGLIGKTEQERREQARSLSDHESGKYQMNNVIGLAAVFVACVLSGLAGIYFEKMLKDSKKISVWVRNVQLSMFSIIPALFIGVLLKDGRNIQEHGFFHGYNEVVWTVIMLQAIGGLAVSLCVKYADNLAKNFATSISILISFVASVYFFDFLVTVNFVAGSTIVVAVTYLYSTSPEGSSASKEYTQLESQIPKHEEQRQLEKLGDLSLPLNEMTMLEEKTTEKRW